MYIKVERETPRPSPPPISEVVIRLSEEEATRFGRFCGRLSRAHIKDVFRDASGCYNQGDEYSDALFVITAGIFSSLQKEGLVCYTKKEER